MNPIESLTLEELLQLWQSFIMVDDADYEIGLPYLQRAVELGDGYSAYALGCCYEHGLGVRKSVEQAAIYYALSSDKNNPNGQAALAGCYRDGKGLEKDLPKAVYWYTKAAEGGHIRSMDDLAVCYESGIGCDANPDLAFKLYCRAFMHGHALAAFHLANC